MCLVVCDFTWFYCVLLCWVFSSVTVCVNLVYLFCLLFRCGLLWRIGCGFICLLGFCFVWCCFLLLADAVGVRLGVLHCFVLHCLLNYNLVLWVVGVLICLFSVY